ncbi:MAG: polyphosphate polymerase domain-containing protein [Bacteroidetes bacterium]|nr:MAG: polyphosphate polymerase domain-containing protein [Bacteroidota bacterium]
MYSSVEQKTDNKLEQFDTVSLDYLNNLNLNCRQDTKYAFKYIELPPIFEELKNNYKILDIENKKEFLYENLYYDTPDLFMYFQHHNGKLNRYKIRYRKYIDNKTCFFEIKRKTNKLTTIKNRIQQERIEETLTDEAKELINGEVNIVTDNLSPKLWVKYSRITLVHNERNEKVTFDKDLSFKGMVNGWSYLPGLVVAEIKQERFNPNSEFIKLMNKLRIREIRISKYATGSIMSYPEIKYNRFKPRLLFINKQCDGQDGYFKFL